MSGKFEPKTAVQLAPPKDDIISLEELSKANGESLILVSSFEFRAPSSRWPPRIAT